MNRIFTLLLLMLGLQGWSQQYNNEWIRFNQTYYKFKVGQTGLYRMPKSALDAAGIGNTPVEFLELWRNGQQVPFSASVSTGVLPANGYLEFWGEMNDGKPDKALYANPAFQHSDKVSLMTDTATFFLSVNTNQSGFRVTEVANNVAANVLPIEPYFMHISPVYFRLRINPGFAAVVGEYVYSSEFDKGEYWSCNEIKPASPLIFPFQTPSIYTSGPGSFLRFGGSGNALNARTVRARINSTDVKDTVMDYFNDVNLTVPISTSLLNSTSNTTQFNNTSAISTDRIVLSYFEVEYPRQFDFGNQKNFTFTLPAKVQGYYLEINNFNFGAVAPVLYDVTNGKKYVGDIATLGKVKFAINPTSVASRFVLVNEETSNIITINSLTSKTFTDYSQGINQGNYLIISHPSLYVGTHGNNPVDDYKNYRQSAEGGAFNVKIINIDELTDQFAFGIKKHPGSIKNFLNYARNTFAVAPSSVFLIGRGMEYTQYRAHESDPIVERLSMIPTFGVPASDNMLSSSSSSSPIPITPIGRLSVVNGKEIEDYLEKVKEYNSAQKNSPNTLAGKQWMKNVVHVTGSSDPFLGTVLCNYMGVYKGIIEDTLFGGKVSTFCKTSTNPVEQLSSDRIGELFTEGISILTYFGHSSATTLEFNLDNPQAYDNRGKYPVFYVNGCNAGNFFNFYPERLVVNETLSEKFVLAKQRGSIAFVASTHFGIVNYLNLLLNGLYELIGQKDFNLTLAETQRDALLKLTNATGPFDYYARMHAEQMTLHGDPALKLNEQSKPDYVIEESLIKINPSFISIAENEFTLKIKTVNIGKATRDSLTVEVKRKYPNGTEEVIYKQRIKAVPFSDSLSVLIPIVATRDKGQNRITVTVDSDQNINEIDENNNTATKEFFIFEDEARAIYPYNFSIINNNTQHLFASTADVFSVERTYVMELDTTENFNSQLKVSKTITSKGGVMEFVPGITYLDSTVYHWRISIAVPQGVESKWDKSSFRYIPGTEQGYNQSNFYQHKKSTVERIDLDSASAVWKYGVRRNNIFIRNGVFPNAASQAIDFSVSVNGSSDMLSVCGVSGIIFYVLDPVTLKPWLNSVTGGSRFGSDVVCGVARMYQFQFNILDPVKRASAVSFMDSIPDGYFVVAKNISGTDPLSNTYADKWMGDTATLGTEKSLYHRLIVQGFTGIDSFSRPRAFIFIYKKNRQFEFVPRFTFSDGIADRINLSVDAITPDTLGIITSPKFGPAKAWKDVIWNGRSLETPSRDNATVEVIGIAPGGAETVLYNLDKDTHSKDISSVSPAAFPYLKLRMRNADSLARTPYQLDYWKIHYDPVPEGALAPNIFLISKDTLDIGETLKFGIAFKNISKTPFDSLDVKVTIEDKDNITHTLNFGKQKPLITGDTARLYFELDSKNYTERNTMFVSFNPDPGQPEQQIFNNFLFKNFYVRTDKTNPILDITFDGVHILSRDIVSAKPHIQIKLKDEAKYMLLNDTTLSTIQVRYPDGVLRTFNFDNDTLRFNPATSGTDNTASIDFNPSFMKQYNPEGDEYELIVKGKDKSGNKAGATEFRVTFKVISKAMISNLLNYPNPFSTSTAFVFTLTGSEIPQNMKIQILTVTGKIVREITMDELGPIRIGRNITEFKWNGTDQYGQKLANGVYLYRVVTTMNGKQMDKYKAEGDNTDKFFNNGYGKMYLMR